MISWLKTEWFWVLTFLTTRSRQIFWQARQSLSEVVRFSDGVFFE